METPSIKPLAFLHFFKQMIKRMYSRKENYKKEVQIRIISFVDKRIKSEKKEGKKVFREGCLKVVKNDLGPQADFLSFAKVSCVHCNKQIGTKRRHKEKVQINIHKVSEILAKGYTNWDEKEVINSNKDDA